MEIYGRGEDARALWSAADTLMLKWVALRVGPVAPPGRLPPSEGKGRAAQSAGRK
ncbi:hypothetical protein [Serratia grimesii]|uniref:hypothetical protein n=1 Tax=Serratia grimesii TaxID=82995 RepID=UPI0021C7E8F5|nr:hypothetical protein [Serratia grimesii]